MTQTILEKKESVFMIPMLKPLSTGIPNPLFRLDSSFLQSFWTKQPNWDVIGYITYKGHYSRKDYDKNITEEFYQTIQRVAEGAFSIRKKYYTEHGILWDDQKEQYHAQRMYQLMWEFKMLPAGRGLWSMGTKLVEEEGSISLNNCSFVSTEDIASNLTFPFELAFDELMQGVGVGFDLKGAGKITMQSPKGTTNFIIPDSRQGWIQGLRLLLRAFFCGESLPLFDYSQLRPKGTPIKRFGGISAGFEPLMNSFNAISKLLTQRIGLLLKSVDVLDIFNYVEKCVVSGNVRRSAGLSLGNYDDDEFVNSKEDIDICNDRRCMSNNSVMGYRGMDYTKLLNAFLKSGGDPAVVYLDNARNYGRMGRDPDYKDIKVKGFNPCFAGFEQLLTDKGYISFEELDGKDVNIVTPTQIVNGKVWCSGEKDTIKLIFGNWKTLTLTPNHVMMTSDGREIEAQDTEDERIRIHKEPNTDFDLLWIKLGFIQGDGQLTRLNGQYGHKGIEINIGKNDHDIMELFGYTENDLESNKRSVYTTEFTEILKQYKFSDMILPERVLPESIPKEKELSFLRGLFSANGCVIKSSRIGFKSTCKELINQLKILLLKHGIESYITTNKSKSVKFSNKAYLCKESYDLNIGKTESVIKFYEEIGFVHKYKTEKLEKTVIEKSPKVIKIEKGEKIKVYDFSVNLIHWGFVNGYLVHNCAEIALESGELCNLAEVFPSHCKDYAEFEETLYYAYLYCKTVSLIMTQWQEVNSIIQRNRRIGTSQSGIIDAFARHGRNTMLEWSDKGYAYLRQLDAKTSALWKVPQSIKLTCVKPSGTVSLLSGVSAGIHYPHSEYYIRRITVAKNSELIPILREAGYPMEECIIDKGAYSVMFPKHEKYFLKSKFDVHIIEQIFNLIDYQHYWADNSVSVTITVKDEEIPLLPSILSFCEDKIKGISLLILRNNYKQAPYEAITKEQYENMTKDIKSIPQFQTTEEGEGDNFCDSGRCTMTKH